MIVLCQIGRMPGSNHSCQLNDMRMYDKPMRGSCIPEIIRRCDSELVHVTTNATVLTWKHTNREPTIILSGRLACMLRKTMSVYVSARNRNHPKI